MAHEVTSELPAAQAAESGRETTVLFADISDSTRLYEAAGDTRALEAIAKCMETLRRAAEAAGGRVVKTMGDEVMALFATPDSAADGSHRMQVAVDALPPVDGHKLAVRIAFHAGPVIQRNNDVFGDTVNLASRLAEQATKGQVLTSAQTVSMLAPALRNATRRLYDITIRGKADDIGLCEFLWRKSPDITHLPGSGPKLKETSVSIRLRFRGKDLVLRRRVESINLGRDTGCNFVITEPSASRHHCLIERRQNNFVIKDHSSNGTFVTMEGEEETVLRRGELTLRGHGWLSFGQPKAQSTEVLEFWCK